MVHRPMLVVQHMCCAWMQRPCWLGRYCRVFIRSREVTAPPGCLCKKNCWPKTQKWNAYECTICHRVCWAFSEGQAEIQMVEKMLTLAEHRRTCEGTSGPFLKERVTSGALVAKFVHACKATSVKVMHAPSGFRTHSAEI